MARTVLAVSAVLGRSQVFTAQRVETPAQPMPTTTTLLLLWWQTTTKHRHSKQTPKLMLKLEVEQKGRFNPSGQGRSRRCRHQPPPPSLPTPRRRRRHPHPHKSRCRCLPGVWTPNADASCRRVWKEEGLTTATLGWVAKGWRGNLGARLLLLLLLLLFLLLRPRPLPGPKTLLPGRRRCLKSSGSWTCSFQRLCCSFQGAAQARCQAGLARDWGWASSSSSSSSTLSGRLRLRGATLKKKLKKLKLKKKWWKALLTLAVLDVLSPF
mmetsp:Transcript_46885/g.94574  ORF Transcript_46885/g.94574 Transcript_46885/m.94574 type:complete len:267 (-) Transcript_46885:412-1212(-)